MKNNQENEKTSLDGEKHLQKTHLRKNLTQNIQRTLKTQQENGHLTSKWAEDGAVGIAQW